MTLAVAYAAFTAALAEALVAAQFLPEAAALRVDPQDLVEPTGDELEVQTSAMVENGQTRPVRQILGRPTQRWVVEGDCRVELMAWGPSGETRLEISAAAVAAVAALPATLPTLAGACERLLLTGLDEAPIEPNGVSKAFTFTLRVRSGDPLGASA